jgi:myo-inositol-1-phosphate synthase
MARRRIGIWFVGARGGVATTTILGLVAMRRSLVGTEGLVTALPKFDGLDLAGFGDLVIGGHDIRQSTLYDEAMKLARVSRALDAALVDRCKSDLEKIDKNLRLGTIYNVGKAIEDLADDDVERKESPRDAIGRVQSDLKAFAKRNELDQVVVINVASTEPPLDDDQLPPRWAELEKLLEKPRRCPLAASSLYAIAALELGYPYVNFTPSTGSAPQAIGELAIERQTCHMGHDGKTGETLLKSALAPLFANRNLQVMSWVGHNIFGNMDAVVLNDPTNKATKVRSKDRLLHQILGYSPQTLVSIEYIESLGDWKTAWDHIHFRGFLGTPMTMQFTWQGCDSLLAAPLVIDLVRLTERAARHGERGLLPFLASFFKSPLGVTEHDFVRQFQMLETWVESVQNPREMNAPKPQSKRASK